MEKVGDIIWDITKYLCVCAKQEVDFICNLEENLQSLEAKWKDLEAMKNDVEAKIKADEETGEMQRSHGVSLWIERIQSIQEVILFVKVYGNKRDWSSRSPRNPNKCLSKCCPKNCSSSYKLGMKVAKMLHEVEDLNTKGQRFGKDDQITQKLPRKQIDQIPLDETVGQDLIFDNVWSSIEANEVGVIGLYGTGGVGKTTLLKKINNELGRRRPDFFVIWVVVSKEPDLDRIMDNIRKSVGIGDSTWSNCSNQEQKTSKIFSALKKKNFVLLLDDVWERLNLSSMGVPHPKDIECVSKVLFTTRSEDVCAKMEAQKSFRVEFLKEGEALELFHEKVGVETINSHPRIKVLAKEMATECKGLPLALIVVGSAMAGVKSIEAWEGSKNRLTSSSWTGPDLETKVFSILKLSYDRLPDDTHKKCLLYCALYPEDYEIQANDIIDKWIGEGLLSKDMTRSVHDICNDGHSVIAKLKLYCLLESVEDDIVVSRSFKMHDMIRDMALWLACDQDKRIKKVLTQGEAITLSYDDVETWKIIERISIIARQDKWFVPPLNCPNLVTLLLRCSSSGLENIKYMSKLKVLQLNAPQVGLGEIGELGLLEYLSLRVYKFYPQELKNLKYLKKLKVFNFYVVHSIHGEIPLEGISSLQQLRVLKEEVIKYAPSLQLLVIGDCNSIEEVIKEDENVDSSSIFSYLANLTLHSMPKLESIHKTTLSFPSLKAIRIYHCSNLKKLPLHSNYAKHKLTLINREGDWWNNLEWDDPAAKHNFQSKFQPSFIPYWCAPREWNAAWTELFE